MDVVIFPATTADIRQYGWMQRINPYWMYASAWAAICVFWCAPSRLLKQENGCRSHSGFEQKNRRANCSITIGAVPEGLLPVKKTDKVCVFISGGSVSLEQIKMLDDIVI